jgi:hypothetical protein
MQEVATTSGRVVSITRAISARDASRLIAS